MSETEHLHEVGQRAFTAVVLPVGVGDEAHRRVEREVRGNRRLFGRIERQPRLHAHQHIQDEKTADVEQQHADRIGHRMLLAALIDAGNLVDRDLDRPQDRRKEGAFAAEHAGHVRAEQRHDGDDDRAVTGESGPNR